MVVLDVLRLPNPENTPEEGEGGREDVREEREEEDFDGDRYLGDMVGRDEDPLYEEAMKITPFWLQKGIKGSEEGWDDVEKEELAMLKNRAFLWGETEEEAREGRRAVGLGLLDLLLAFCYDWRTTGGDPTVESAWTMTTLSPSLCYLETYRGRYGGREGGNEGVRKVVRTFMRRVVTYPYLRIWALAESCVEDVSGMLREGGRRGRRVMLRCLLRMRRVFRRTETHYLLNRLFLDDYCVMLQSTVGQIVVQELGEAWREGGQKGVRGVRVGKEEVGLGLVELERLLEEKDEEEEEDDDDEEEDYEGEESDSEEVEEEESSSEEGEEAEEEVEEEEEEEEEEEGTSIMTAALREASLTEKQKGRQGEKGAVEEKEGKGEGEDLSVDIASLSMDPKRPKLDFGEGGGGGGRGGGGEGELLVSAKSNIWIIPRGGEDNEERGGEGGGKGYDGGEKGWRKTKAQERGRPLIEEL